MPERERMMWRGQIVTVLHPMPKRKRDKVRVRDSYGVPVDVPSGELKPLRDDDTRRRFNYGGD